MTEMTSALRRPDSASRLRLAECRDASATGLRDASSVSSVTPARIVAPMRTVTPSQKWKAKQIAM